MMPIRLCDLCDLCGEIRADVRRVLEREPVDPAAVLRRLPHQRMRQPCLAYQTSISYSVRMIGVSPYPWQPKEDVEHG